MLTRFTRDLRFFASAVPDESPATRDETAVKRRDRTPFLLFASASRRRAHARSLYRTAIWQGVGRGCQQIHPRVKLTL